MTAVFFVMRFDVAPIFIWIFELPLDQEIRAVRVIRILLGLERGLVAVAIAEDRSGYVVGVKMHASPQPPIRFKKAYRDPSSFETASPRFRHDTHAADSTWLFWLERLTGSVGGDFSPLRPEAVLRDKRGERPKGGGNPSFAGTRADDEVAPIPAVRGPQSNRKNRP